MERLHIVILGACNSGKSAVANMLTRQQVSLVADQRGTTTDPVRKVMELPLLGPVMIVDTPGFDDETILGKERVTLTRKALDEAGAVILLVGNTPELEAEWRDEIKRRKIPCVEIANKSDLNTCPAVPLSHPGTSGTSGTSGTNGTSGTTLPISALLDPDKGREAIIAALLEKMPEDFGKSNLLRGLVAKGDTVVLVMPQDASAPKGRLILPQVQTLRALLDIGAIAISVTPEQLPASLAALRDAPKLIITDSQVFKEVAPMVPRGTLLTSFSVLMAAHKGDIDFFVTSARAIDSLTESSRVLIAEACTHAPQSEDIGTVKIPALLRKKIGAGLTIDHVAGRDFPEDLTPYDLVIHCGGCMFNRPFVLSRISRGKEQGVPITNYGITIAHLTGILPQVVY